MKNVLVIGGGLGGLSCAVSLASKGYRVKILEKESCLGGKLKRVRNNGYTFDLGPSTITMISSFEKVFKEAGRKMEDYLEFYKISPLTRNFFHDGSIVDFTENKESMKRQIALYSEEDAKTYEKYLSESDQFYTVAEDQFLNKLLLSWRDKADTGLMKGLWRIKPFTSMQRRLSAHFTHPNTLALFGRYATYVGSSPYKAPAIFQMMAALEGNTGIYGVKGGTYSIVEAFVKLAEELDVEIETNAFVKKIVISDKKVTGVQMNEGTYPADIIVANGDFLSINKELIEEKKRPSLRDKKIEKLEPSLSGFAMLLGIDKQYKQLSHHNVFFPKEYEQEFKDIFEENVMPGDPAIYICYSGYSEPEMAKENHSNLFVLVNAPYLTDKISWNEEKERYSEKIISLLERKGLTNLRESVRYKEIMTPEDIRQNTGAHRGAIYGISSNSFKQAFFKMSNKAKDISGLWFVGGSTHPGGGTPIVVKSGILVADAIASGR